MDWFERLTGFRETSYEETRERLDVREGRLYSSANSRSYGVGTLELVSLAKLRERASGLRPSGRTTVTNISGDARALHRSPELGGALFQVASQFNLLEMVHEGVTPEQGVTRYDRDHTQGPACAIAAGAATIYRNYFAPVGDQLGQTTDRQLDALADVGAALEQMLGRPSVDLWEMRNGYALCRAEGLALLADLLNGMSEHRLDALRGQLRIGVQWDVEVTDGESGVGNIVSQAFCSALPVAYRAAIPRDAWGPFAKLILEAAYEATLLAAVVNADLGGSNVVLLTRVGGGVFGNDDAWIDTAMLRSIRLAGQLDLDIRLVSYGSPPPSMLAIERAFR
jgi:hypothetical protein